jgi:hypothetical protein
MFVIFVQFEPESDCSDRLKEEYPVSTFTQIHPVFSGGQTAGRTGMVVLVVAFRSCCANALTSYFPPQRNIASPLERLVSQSWFRKLSFSVLGIIRNSEIHSFCRIKALLTLQCRPWYPVRTFISSHDAGLDVSCSSGCV